MLFYSHSIQRHINRDWEIFVLPFLCPFYATGKSFYAITLTLGWSDDPDKRTHTLHKYKHYCQVSIYKVVWLPRIWRTEKPLTLQNQRKYVCQYYSIHCVVTKTYINEEKPNSMNVGTSHLFSEVNGAKRNVAAWRWREGVACHILRDCYLRTSPPRPYPSMWETASLAG